MRDKDNGIKINQVGDNPRITVVQQVFTHWPFMLVALAIVSLATVSVVLAVRPNVSTPLPAQSAGSLDDILPVANANPTSATVPVFAPITTATPTPKATAISSPTTKTTYPSTLAPKPTATPLLRATATETANAPKLLLDVRHSGHGFSLYSILLDALKTKGIILEKKAEELTPGLLSSYDAVWIEGGLQGVPFSDQEMEALHSFLLGGGKVFLTSAGWTWVPYGSDYYVKSRTMENFPLNILLSAYHIKILDDYFIDDVNTRPNFGRSIRTFSDGAIWDGVNAIYLRPVMSTVSHDNEALVLLHGSNASHSTQLPVGSQPSILIARTVGNGLLLVGGGITSGFDDKVDPPSENPESIAIIQRFDNLQFAINLFTLLVS